MIKWLVRIGCAVGVLVIAAAGCLVLLGGGRRIAHTQTAVTLNYPAAQIWPWLVEPAHLKQWLGGFVDSIPADQGGLRVGAQSTEVLDLDGRRWELHAQITALEPPRHLALHMSAAEFEDDTEYLLEEHAGVTQVIYKNDAHYTMLLARLMSPIINHDVERKVQTDLAKLNGLLAREVPSTLVAPPRPGAKPAFAGCCAPEPEAQK